MRTPLKSLAVAGVAALALSMPLVSHAREDMDLNKFVTTCDADKDGMVSKAEVMKQVEKMFDKHDKAKSGKLDKKQVEFFLKELMKGGA
jgi:hypothetical protein